MPPFSLAPVISLLAQMGWAAPTHPIRTLLRSTDYKLRPPQPRPWVPVVRWAQQAVLAGGRAAPHQLAGVLCEERKGTVPTIVLGGFVPDPTEAVYLLRGFLLRQGSLYYVQYPRRGFSIELLFAQLDDLVEELAVRHGRCPVILSISFGGGLVLEWLRRARLAGRPPGLGGLVFVSPVACVADLLAPGESKPSTLIGRALHPFLAMAEPAGPAVVARSRGLFLKMFEAGAQNRRTLRTILTKSELLSLHAAIEDSLHRTNETGACERVQALRALAGPGEFSMSALGPLSQAPALVLYAEKESSVLIEGSPTRAAFATMRQAMFPHSHEQVVTNPGGNPVQHASLIFHCFNFLPLLTSFYHGLKAGRSRQAA